MTVPGNANPLLMYKAAAAGGYQISRSLRFNSADSANLSRNFSGTSTDRKLQTISFWVKRTVFATRQILFTTYDGSSSQEWRIFFETSDILRFQFGGSSTFLLDTTQVFRDPSAWYHILYSVDTTQATDSNRVKLYVNGSQVTAFNTAAYPSQNNTSQFPSANTNNRIGSNYDASGNFANVYLADIYFIDGTALTPSSFGETDADGVWQPKTPTGLTYGTNGFHLDFADNSAATASTLGKDTSGNGNNWTPNNLSVTAGAGNDSLRDSPTNGTQTDTGVGGEVVGNYNTFNPLQKNTNITLSNGNLDCSGTGVYSALTTIYFPSSEKYYAEFLINGTDSGYPAVGILAPNDAGLTAYANPNTGAVYFQGGYITRDGATVVSSITALNTNDIVRVAYDPATRNVWFALNNGSWVGGGNPATGSTPTTTLNANTRGYSFGVSVFTNAGVTLNAGARAFAYTAPSGFKALCTANLPAPTITKGSSAMDVKLYTGTGATQTISGLNFSPDFVWLKRRDAAGYWHELYDIVRGVEKRIFSNTTNAEETTTNLTAFTSTGFTLGSSDAGVNGSGGSYVAWTWDAGTSNATNTSGSITSTVRANISAGFSVVTYTGSGSTATIGHGLGVAPEFLIVKCRSHANDWIIYHKSMGDKWIQFDTGAANDAPATIWNDTAPTSSVFSVGTSSALNVNARTFVAYCWAPVAGYSAFGSYTGNGSSDGPFVYTGFRPRWILTKTTNGVNHWDIYDAARNSYNVANAVLKPNSSGAESTLVGFDLLSNGFKARGTDSENNGSGDTYIWAAFAENPFKIARAR